MAGLNWKREVEWYQPAYRKLGESPHVTHDRKRMIYVSHEDAVDYYRRQLEGAATARERAIVLRHLLRDQRTARPDVLRRLLRDVGFHVGD